MDYVVWGFCGVFCFFCLCVGSPNPPFSGSVTSRLLVLLATTPLYLSDSLALRFLKVKASLRVGGFSFFREIGGGFLSGNLRVPEVRTFSLFRLFVCQPGTSFFW